MCIAYLVSQYPASSHTFIRREVQALRDGGLDVQTFSIRSPMPAEVVSEADKRAFAETFYALPPKLGPVLKSHLWALAQPGTYARTLKKALGHRTPGAKSAVWSVFHFAEAILLAKEMKARGITHVHNHFGNAGANVGLLASTFLNLPYSITLHAHSEFDYPAGPILPEKIEHADFVACISYYTRSQAYRITTPDQWDKMHIVRCGLDLSQLPEKKDRTGQRLRLICVARMDPEKGHIGLLRAFANQRDQGLDAEMVFIGDGHYRPKIEAEVARLGLQDMCTLLGRQPDTRVLEEVSNSDVLVMASFMEGLPVVLMEALSLSVPVITPTLAGIPELVDDKCGILYASGDWDALSAAIGTLAKLSPSQRADMGAVGRQRIEAQFDINRAVEPLLEYHKNQA